MPLKAPSYRKRKSGQATVRIAIDGKNRDFYLGPYGSPQSKERYEQVLAEHWQPNHQAKPGEWPTIEELMASYLHFCKTKYAAGNENANINLAFMRLRLSRAPHRCRVVGPKAARWVGSLKSWCCNTEILRRTEESGKRQKSFSMANRSDSHATMPNAPRCDNRRA